MKKMILGLILLAILVAGTACVNTQQASNPLDENNEDSSTISVQYMSFNGYIEDIEFELGNNGNGHLILRGDTYESGITPYIRVVLDEGITMADVLLSDLEVGQRVTVYHTLKGLALRIEFPV